MTGGLDMKDLGLGAMLEALEEIANTSITFGWQGESGAKPHPGTNGMDTATLGAIHELGTTDGRIPARPGLSLAMESGADRLNEAVAEGMSDLVDGRADVTDVVRSVGALGVGLVRDNLKDAEAWAEELAPSTVKAKRRAGAPHPTRPLHRTGTLAARVSWAERQGDAIVIQGGEDE